MTFGERLLQKWNSIISRWKFLDYIDTLAWRYIKPYQRYRMWADSRWLGRMNTTAIAKAKGIK